MLTIGLAEIIDDTDPCTPGSAGYATRDPELCALYAGTTPDAEIEFNPVNVRESCPPGFQLIAGTCIPTLVSQSFNWKPIAITAGALGLVYGIARYLSKKK